MRDGKTGIVYTRTGRAFFNDETLEQAIIDRLQSALTTAGFWDEFKTTWVCLDCELMPWSAKAQELLRSQYAAVGAAGRAALPVAVERIADTLRRSELPTEETVLLQTLMARYSSRDANPRGVIDPTSIGRVRGLSRRTTSALKIQRSAFNVPPCSALDVYRSLHLPPFRPKIRLRRP